MIKDIRSQPERLKLLLSKYIKDEKAKKSLKNAVHLLENTQKPIIFAGMGSSNYAAISAINILSEKGYLCMRPDIDEFIHYQMNSLTSDYTIIAISQSGKSIETKKFVAKTYKDNNIISVTNDEESPIAQMSDFVLPIFAGEEATISTKTFTNSNFILNILAFLVNNQEYNLNNLEQEIDLLEQIIEEEEEFIDKIYKHIKDRDKWTFISRGDLLSAVYTGTLICEEGTGLQPVGFSAGSFRHGPLEITGNDHGAVIMAKNDNTFDLIIKLAEEMADNESNIILITDKYYDNENENILVHVLPQIDRLLQVTEFSIPMQFLTRKTAIAQGRTPGVLNKITKVTKKE